MNILILSNPDYISFIENVVQDYWKHVYVWYAGKFDFPFNYDIGISFMYQYKVPKEEVEAHTWINFHPAPLPEYKGRNLCYYALMWGEKEFGATIHYMDKDFDTGDIIEVRKFNIEKWWTAFDLSTVSKTICEEMFTEYFPHIIAGEKFNRIPNVGGTYHKSKPIGDYINLPIEYKNQIRAITYKDFYPKIDIGGVTYKIVRDE